MKQLIQLCLGKAHNKNPLFFKTWSHVFQACLKLARDSLELLIHLPPPPKCWNDRCLSHLDYVVLGMEPRALCVPSRHSISEPHARSRLILSENLTLYTCCNPALGRLSREDLQCEVSQLRSKVRPSLKKKKKKKINPKPPNYFYNF